MSLTLRSKALLIEQKDGTLEETGDGLIAHYADALDHVRDKFRRRQGGRTGIDQRALHLADHALRLPDLLPVASPRGRQCGGA